MATRDLAAAQRASRHAAPSTRMSRAHACQMRSAAAAAACAAHCSPIWWRRSAVVHNDRGDNWYFRAEAQLL